MLNSSNPTKPSAVAAIIASQGPISSPFANLLNECSVKLVRLGYSKHTHTHKKVPVCLCNLPVTGHKRCDMHRQTSKVCGIMARTNRTCFRIIIEQRKGMDGNCVDKKGFDYQLAVAS